MIVAHALGGVRDLPVPGILFLYGGAVVLGLSFIALGVLWPSPMLEEAAEGRPLPPLLQRILLSRALHVVLAAAAVFVYVLVLVASVYGIRDINANVAPTTVWVIFWLGLVYVSLALGNVWRVINPIRAIADVVAWATRGVRWVPFEYPERLGIWPAAVVLFAVTAMELVYPTPADPPAVGAAVAIYSIITWAGMFLFGRETWLDNGDAFTVYFGLFARMAPFTLRKDDDGRRELLARAPFAGLQTWRPGPGGVAMVAVMLGSVGFDSLTRTTAWQNFQTNSLTSLAVRIPVTLVGLVAVVCFVAGAYYAAIRFAHRVTQADFALAPRFLASLVPIAFVYSVAHYITLLVSQGQFVIPLASDPFGKGWNLFGSAHYIPNLVPIGPHPLWYTQVGVLVAGHVVGLVLAHDRSVALFEGAASLRSQYAMLALMVLYTCGGLYLLSSP